MIISQKTYPVLPESGMMHVSVYNGLDSLNSSLSCSGFENEVVITNPNGKVGNIKIQDPIQELFIPQNAYRIDDVTYSCEDGSINFEKKTFDPPQMVGNTFRNTFLVIMCSLSKIRDMNLKTIIFRMLKRIVRMIVYLPLRVFCLPSI